MAKESVEQPYQKVKANLLAEESKLIQVLSARDFLHAIVNAREAVLHRIRNDDDTLTHRDMKLSFTSNQLDKLTWDRILEQDNRCASLRNEWCALLKLKAESR